MVTAWSRHGHGVLSASRPLHRGTITARSLHGHGTVTAWVRYVHGMGMAWERQWHGTVTASSRCRRRGSAWDGSGPLRLPARKNVVCVCVCVCARALTPGESSGTRSRTVCVFAHESGRGTPPRPLGGAEARVRTRE